MRKPVLRIGNGLFSLEFEDDMFKVMEIMKDATQVTAFEKIGQTLYNVEENRDVELGIEMREVFKRDDFNTLKHNFTMAQKGWEEEHVDEQAAREDVSSCQEEQERSMQNYKEAINEMKYKLDLDEVPFPEED